MPIQPMSNRSSMPSRPSVASALHFTPLEWDLLVGLPRQVLIAATAAEHDTPKHTVAEGLAGIEAIAAGRASPSRLVRDVVAAIYAEPLEDSPATGELTDPATGLAGMLAECRAAARLLTDRTPAEDAAAYRGWLAGIATTVCAAARTGGVLGFGGTPVSAAERRFLDELDAALRP
jgi:hypothetical protein